LPSLSVAVGLTLSESGGHNRTDIERLDRLRVTVLKLKDLCRFRGWRCWKLNAVGCLVGYCVARRPVSPRRQFVVAHSFRFKRMPLRRGWPIQCFWWRHESLDFCPRLWLIDNALEAGGKCRGEHLLASGALQYLCEEVCHWSLNAK
jgi:hypothetical protein